MTQLHHQFTVLDVEPGPYFFDVFHFEGELPFLVGLNPVVKDHEPLIPLVQDLSFFEQSPLHDKLIAFGIFSLVQVDLVVHQQQLFNDDLGHEDKQIVLGVVLQEYSEFDLSRLLALHLVVGQTDALLELFKQYLQLCYLGQPERCPALELQLGVSYAAHSILLFIVVVDYATQLKLVQPVRVQEHLLLLQQDRRRHLVLAQVEKGNISKVGNVIGHLQRHLLDEVLELLQVGIIGHLGHLLDDADLQLGEDGLGADSGVMSFFAEGLLDLCHMKDKVRVAHRNWGLSCEEDGVFVFFSGFLHPCPPILNEIILKQVKQLLPSLSIIPNRQSTTTIISQQKLFPMMKISSIFFTLSTILNVSSSALSAREGTSFALRQSLWRCWQMWNSCSLYSSFYFEMSSLRL